MTPTGTTPSIARHAPAHVPTRLIAVPYYLWNNRGKGTMMVWLPEIE